MPGFLTSGPGLFPGWISILFSLGLASGIVHHLPCLLTGRGSRWFHAGHAAMALSMIYMYLSMSYDWNWLPAAWQMWFFVATSLAIAGRLVVSFLRRRPVNLLWVLLLVQQAAMACMWYPMMRWNAVLIFVLVSWFAVEAFGWIANLLPDDTRMVENRSWFPYKLGGGVDGPAHSLAGPAADQDCRCVDHLIVSDWKERGLMAIMAVSMGYMFYGMQLMH